jgi:DnaJ-class molecular chaperone
MAGAPKDVEVTLECTMKDFYCGSVVLITFERQEIHHVPKVSTAFIREKYIEVKPGYSEETVLVFKGEGNAAYNQHTSDLVIKFKQIPHPLYSRSGNHLVIRVPVSLEDALAQKPVTFQTLDGRNLTVMPGEEISP